MPSQLENGKLVPTLPTLARIAMVFDVGWSTLRRAEKPEAFRRDPRGERMRFPERSDKPNPAYFFECLAFSAQEKSLQAYFAEFRREQPTRSRSISMTGRSSSSCWKEA